MKKESLQRMQDSRRRFAALVLERTPKPGEQPPQVDPQQALEEKEEQLARAKNKRKSVTEARDRASRRFEDEIGRLDEAISRLEAELKKERNLLKGVTVVPEVVGLAELEALAALSAVALQAGVESDQPSSDQIGRILKQEPAAGTEVKFGSTVYLTIGGVRIPPVVGLTRAKAAQELEKRQLTVSSTGNPRGYVTEQDPAAGTFVVKGTAVQLTLGGTGLAARNRVVDLMQANPEFREIGFSEAELRQRLDDLGIATRNRLVELPERSDRQLQEDLGLPAAANAEVFRRLLTRALEKTKSG